MTTRQVHTTEIKRDAVQLARTSSNISSTARDLEINISLLRKKMTAEQGYGWAAFPGQGRKGLYLATFMTGLILI